VDSIHDCGGKGESIHYPALKGGAIDTNTRRDFSCEKDSIKARSCAKKQRIGRRVVDKREISDPKAW